MAETLHHTVPRLDAPDRVWMIPMPVAKWLGAGIVSGSLANYGVAFWNEVSLDQALNEPAVWLVWGIGITLSLVGAFVRPGGLHAARWASVLVDYLLVPRRAVWKPVKE